jgi:hypothetical protein
VKARSQSGLSQIEVLVASALGVLLVLIGGYLFKIMTKGYKHIGDQARQQAGMKKALQSMTREISNSGAFLDNPRRDLALLPHKFQSSYLDLKGKYCQASETVTLAFSVQPGEGGGNTLIQDVRCNGRTVPRRILATSPGGLSLDFNYMDGKGNVTANPAAVKLVELKFSMLVKSKSGNLPVMERTQTLRVECVNL